MSNHFLKMSHLINSLNPEQQKAVLTTQGPVLIIAGAGSGKTRALTHRIAYLIQEKKIQPWNILAVTFTNKAANEMKERVRKLVEGNENQEGKNENQELRIKNQEDKKEAELLETENISKQSLGANDLKCPKRPLRSEAESLGMSDYDDYLASQPVDQQTSRPVLPENQKTRKPDRHLPTIGTFHAVCVRILRQEMQHLKLENSFVIYDTADTQALMKRILKKLQIDEKQFNPRAILSRISSAKNSLIKPEGFSSQAVGSYFDEKVAEIYPIYQKELCRNSALDFDDIIMNTVEIFQKFPEVLGKYQEKFQYICVDEYQDTNQAQYVLTNLLAKKYRNLCVIGDSDQSIYSWRGANIQNILDFEKDYPEAQVILLEQNYRSTQVILDAAHKVISKNSRRRDKKLWTDRKGGHKIQLREARDEQEEGYMIVKEIEKMIGGSSRWAQEVTEGIFNETPDKETSKLANQFSDFAILYRTNAQSRVLEEVFLRSGIPYRIVGGVKFYARKEVKDILSYLRITQNSNDSISLLRVLNTPPRNIGLKTIEALQDFANSYDVTLFEAIKRVEENEKLSDAKKTAVKKFAKLIERLKEDNQKFPVSGLIKNVISATDFKKFLEDGTAQGDVRYENILELISVATKYDALEPGISLSTFLEEVALISDVDQTEEKENSVTMMTMHSAKGLEFPVVFVVGMEQGIFPHSRSLLELMELEEERRLFYVAITRAQSKLYLLRARQRLFFGDMQNNAPSEFLLDIPPELRENIDEAELANRGLAKVKLPNENISMFNLEEPPMNIPDLKDGDRVLHKMWGEGMVISIAGGVITIVFKDPKIGIKKLALSVAPLRKVE